MMQNSALRRLIGPVNLTVTWCALFFRELLKHGLSVICGLILWLCFALSPLATFFPSLITSLISYLILGFTLYHSVKLIRHFKTPNFKDILRQLEESNQLNNRPLRSLLDQLPAKLKEKSDTAQLWSTYKRDTIAKLPKLSPGWIKPVLAKKDPFALRFLAFFLLVIFSFSNPKSWTDALNDSLLPPDLFTPPVPITVDGWITPPDYTRMATILLDKPQANTIDAIDKLTLFPDGSTLVLQTNNTTELPSFFIDNIAVEAAFEKLGGNSYRLTMPITRDGFADLKIEDETIQSWNFRLIPDLPPEVQFKGQIAQTNRKSMRIPFMAMDDYGVSRIDLRLTRNFGQSELEKILQFPLIESNGLKRDLSSNHFLDLTAHPWAGLQVTAELLVYDALDQLGSSLPQIVTLPQRVFTHPVARQIIAIRRSVAAAEDHELRSHAIQSALLAEKSEDYDHDRAVYMSLHIVARRLVAKDRSSQKENVMRLLWETALYVEEGEAIANLSQLQNAEKDLMDALNRGASDEEINRLMQALEQAMAEYMEALARELQSSDAPKSGLQRQLDASRMMDSQSIQSMMEQLRELLELGMMDAARDLLAEIQNIMENLQMAEEEDLPDNTLEAVELLQDMEEIMKKQQRLMERSHNRAMGRQSDPEEGQSNSGSVDNMQAINPEDIAEQAKLAEKLQELRETYQRLMQQAPPENLGKSQNAMGAAKGALEQGDNHQASEQQGKAIDALQQALNKIEESVIERFMNSNQQAISSETSPEGQGRDPFGRNTPNSGSRSSEGTKIPSASQMGRAHSIQQELRRRFNEKTRDIDELNYIEKLLNSFP